MSDVFPSIKGMLKSICCELSNYVVLLEIAILGALRCTRKSRY